MSLDKIVGNLKQNQSWTAPVAAIGIIALLSLVGMLQNFLGAARFIN